VLEVVHANALLAVVKLAVRCLDGAEQDPVARAQIDGEYGFTTKSDS
jgi:hypothetical protein